MAQFYGRSLRNLSEVMDSIAEETDVHAAMLSNEEKQKRKWKPPRIEKKERKKKHTPEEKSIIQFARFMHAQRDQPRESLVDHVYSHYLKPEERVVPATGGLEKYKMQSRRVAAIAGTPVLGVGPSTEQLRNRILFSKGMVRSSNGRFQRRRQSGK